MALYLNVVSIENKWFISCTFELDKNEYAWWNNWWWMDKMFNDEIFLPFFSLIDMDSEAIYYTCEWCIGNYWMKWYNNRCIFDDYELIE